MLNQRYSTPHQYCLTIRIPTGCDPEAWVARVEMCVTGDVLSVAAMYCIHLYTDDIPTLVRDLHREGFDLGAP